MQLDDTFLQKLDDNELKLITASTCKDEVIMNLLAYIVEQKDKFATKDEVLQYFKIPRQRFEQLLREEKISHFKINNKIRIFNKYEIENDLLKHFKVPKLEGGENEKQ